jgi:hypothetical protein
MILGSNLDLQAYLTVKSIHSRQNIVNFTEVFKYNICNLIDSLDIATSIKMKSQSATIVKNIFL